MASNVIDNFINTNYRKGSYIDELDIIKKDISRKLKIKLHNKEGDEFEFDYKSFTNYSKPNTDLTFPYDNIPIFNYYSKRDERFDSVPNFIQYDIFKKFIKDNYSELYNNFNPTKIDISNTLLYENTLNNNKYFKSNTEYDKNIFNMNLSGDNKIENLIFDLYFFTKKFISTDNNNIDILKSVFTYNLLTDKSTGDQITRYMPASISSATQEKIFDENKKYLYGDEVKEPDDNFKLIVTYVNVFKILEKILKPNFVFRVTNSEKGETKTYQVKTAVQKSETYKTENKVTSQYLEFHFNIELEEIDDIDQITINLDLVGDIKKNNIEFKPNMMDLKNPKYKNNNIYIINNYKITDRLLSSNEFNLKGIDKRLVFLQRDLMEFILKYYKDENRDKNIDTQLTSEQIQEKKSENFRDNIDLLVKYFFMTSTDPENKFNGILFYNSKEYYIHKAVVKEYFTGEKSYQLIDVPFKDAKIYLEYKDFIEKDVNIFVYVDKTKKELSKIKGIIKDENKLDYLQYLQGYKKQIYEINPSDIFNISGKTEEEIKKIQQMKEDFTVELKTTLNDEITGDDKYGEDEGAADNIMTLMNIPYSAINIIVDEKNKELFKKIQSILYKGKEYELNPLPQPKLAENKFTVFNKDKEISKGSEFMNEDTKVSLMKYKIKVELTVLDKSSGKKIDFVRKMFSTSCNTQCKNIDTSITDAFKPLLKEKKFDFFSRLLNRTFKRDKYDFKEVFKKTNPDLVKDGETTKNTTAKNKDSSDKKSEVKDSSDKKGEVKDVAKDPAKQVGGKDKKLKKQKKLKFKQITKKINKKSINNTSRKLKLKKNKFKNPSKHKKKHKKKHKSIKKFKIFKKNTTRRSRK